MNRKFLFSLALFSLVTIGAKAQLKVGNNPTSINTNSVLEMESTNKGMLLPRVALTGTASVAPLTTHVAGMSVYNTATAGDVTPGYYYDDGTKWVRLADAAALGGSGSLHVSIPGEAPASQGLFIKWNDPISTASSDPGHTLLGMTSFINNRGTGPGGFIFANTAGDGTSITQLLRILSNGNVGIGTIDPGSKLSVVGLAVFADNAAAASLNAGDFYRTATGQVMVKY